MPTILGDGSASSGDAMMNSLLNLRRELPVNPRREPSS